MVAYPLTWTTSEGKDGRMVAYPLTWTTSEGKDGRKVAYPLTWTIKQSPDGRCVPVPQSDPVPLLFHDATLVGKIFNLHEEKDSDVVAYAIYLWANDNE